METVFLGTAFGCLEPMTGEVVFNTGMDIKKFYRTHHTLTNGYDDVSFNW